MYALSIFSFSIRQATLNTLGIIFFFLLAIWSALLFAYGIMLKQETEHTSIGLAVSSLAALTGVISSNEIISCIFFPFPVPLLSIGDGVLLALVFIICTAVPIVYFSSINNNNVKTLAAILLFCAMLLCSIIKSHTNTIYVSPPFIIL